MERFIDEAEARELLTAPPLDRPRIYALLQTPDAKWPQPIRLASTTMLDRYLEMGELTELQVTNNSLEGFIRKS